MIIDDIIVPMPQKRKPDMKKKAVRRLKAPRYKLLSFGQQCQMIRETRRISITNICRMIEVTPGLIRKIERYNGEGVSFQAVNLYMKAIGATMIAIPMPIPSYVDVNTESVKMQVSKGKTNLDNLFKPDEDE